MQDGVYRMLLKWQCRCTGLVCYSALKFCLWWKVLAVLRSKNLKRTYKTDICPESHKCHWLSPAMTCALLFWISPKPPEELLLQTLEISVVWEYRLEMCINFMNSLMLITQKTEYVAYKKNRQNCLPASTISHCVSYCNRLRFYLHIFRCI